MKTSKYYENELFCIHYVANIQHSQYVFMGLNETHDVLNATNKRKRLSFSFLF